MRKNPEKFSNGIHVDYCQTIDKISGTIDLHQLFSNF